ncbi:MAG: helix-turn-helix domain-containing protein [Thermoanaerobaculia bacterium]
MRESKKKRLEKKGWRIGSAADFLELTPEESAYIEVKIRLSQALRELRRKATLTQTELAHRLRSSQSRVAKMEAGDPSVSIDLLTRSLIALGASPKDIARAISGRA